MQFQVLYPSSVSEILDVLSGPAKERLFCPVSIFPALLHPNSHLGTDFIRTETRRLETFQQSNPLRCLAGTVKGKGHFHVVFILVLQN